MLRPGAAPRPAPPTSTLDSPPDPTESAARVFPLPHVLNARKSFAALALLVVLLGLPRFLVLCTAEGEAPHLDFAHAPGDCCEHAHATGHDEAPTPAEGTAARPAAPHCEHSEFASELAPAPRPLHAPAAPPTVALWTTAPPPLASRADAALRHRAPSTGPPRPGPRWSLRTTTLLLL